ncbi:MAG: hypothetical protein IR164_17455 [Devosia sp.]|uniref:hypothetical protein n=1 Tax=Devosia sp. TaxID=1871048 RepID=UPI0019E9E33B|nr:hypothetical protein [Devosia sp.]MBF0680715.1 hypothetical protein [Devosia sp.]
MTEVSIRGADFYIDGKITYEGRYHAGRRIEGLLMNSRMVQATFDDELPETAGNWAYPDTGVWDPDRNTREFIAMLPTYRKKGLLGITVGFQGGGSIYTKPLSDTYINSAFNWDGSLKPAYMARLAQVLDAADKAGLVVIVNYFYWRQERFESDDAVRRATREATRWLLETGHRNIILDIKNEFRDQPGLLSGGGIHELIEIAKSETKDGRRLLVGSSSHAYIHLPCGPWMDMVDLFLPHGNDLPPRVFREQLKMMKTSATYLKNPRPICCNEDSIDLDNMEAAIEAGCSWGYYDQGYGCDEKQVKCDWASRPRETSYADLSGFQTMPVNWSINTEHKHAFFDRLEAITGGL